MRFRASYCCSSICRPMTLVLSPTSRKAMPGDSDMGINSRGAVRDVETLLASERSRRRHQSACTNNSNNSAVMQQTTPRAVTESDASDTDTKLAQGSGEGGKLQKRKIEKIEGQGEEDQGPSGVNSVAGQSLPQHEQILPVDPMDISYCATPASLRLRAVLLSRLDAAVHTGKIQVVSSIKTLSCCIGHQLLLFMFVPD